MFSATLKLLQCNTHKSPEPIVCRYLCIYTLVISFEGCDFLDGAPYWNFFKRFLFLYQEARGHTTSQPDPPRGRFDSTMFSATVKLLQCNTHKSPEPIVCRYLCIYTLVISFEGCDFLDGAPYWNFFKRFLFLYQENLLTRSPRSHHLPTRPAPWSI